MTPKILFETIYPGASDRFEHFRQDLQDVVSSPGLVPVLIEGHPGSGKTTLARTLAIARVLAMVRPEHHKIGIDRATAMILNKSAITWYRDISLAGLTEGLADSQLFGLKPGGASGTSARIGVFEQAMTAADPREVELSHQKLLASARQHNRWIPLLTGGVVLLDEIGDAGEWLQLKLLRLLNGEKLYRVQGEGEAEFEFTFRGMVVLATWRNIETTLTIRPDLRQRICQKRIKMPSLDEYSSEALRLVILNIVATLQQRAKEELEILDALSGENQEVKNTKDSDALANDIIEPTWRRALTTKLGLMNEQLDELTKQHWGSLGEFRGLYSVIDHTLRGGSLDKALTDAALNHTHKNLERDSTINDFQTLRKYLSSAESISKGFQADKLSWAERMNARLKNHDREILNLIAACGQSRSLVKKQLENILRSKESE